MQRRRIKLPATEVKAGNDPASSRVRPRLKEPEPISTTFQRLSPQNRARSLGMVVPEVQGMIKNPSDAQTLRRDANEAGKALEKDEAWAWKEFFSLCSDAATQDVNISV